MEHVFRRRLGVELRYSLVRERTVLRVEGRRFGDRWINYYPLAEYNPICRITESNGREHLRMFLALGIISAGFLLISLALFLVQLSSGKAIYSECCFFLLAGAIAFGLCSVNPFLKYRDDRSTSAVFDNFFRQWSFVIVVPRGENAETHPFVREVRHAAAACFRMSRPVFSTPETTAQLQSEYETLRKTDALTEEELELLFRKLFGGVPSRRSIGFDAI